MIDLDSFTLSSWVYSWVTPTAAALSALYLALGFHAWRSVEDDAWVGAYFATAVFGFFALLILCLPIKCTFVFQIGGKELDHVTCLTTRWSVPVLLFLLCTFPLIPIVWFRLGPHSKFRLTALVCAAGWPAWVLLASLTESSMPTDPTIQGALYGAGATLVAALIAAVIAWKQFLIQRDQLALLKDQFAATERDRDEYRKRFLAIRQALDEGPKRFVRRFGTLIASAREAGTSSAASGDLVPRARAIVSQRNSLKEELGGLERLLNSDIDILSTQLSAPGANWDEIRGTVETLHAKWAQKEDEVNLRIRRLLAVLEFVLDVDSLEPTRAPT